MNIADKLTVIAENVQKVYDAGKKDGLAEFTDAYLKMGKTYGNWNRAFSGLAWTDSAYNKLPKFKKTLYYAHEMFNNTGMTTIDEELDFTNLKAQPANVFRYGNTTLKTIRTIIVNENNTLSDWFGSCGGLVTVVFSGAIGNSLSFKDCHQLSRDSITNIINTLALGEVSNTLTLSLTAVNKAFETSENTNDGSSSGGWTALVESKPSNWTITLV